EEDHDRIGSWRWWWSSWLSAAPCARVTPRWWCRWRSAIAARCRCVAPAIAAWSRIHARLTASYGGSDVEADALRLVRTLGGRSAGVVSPRHRPGRLRDLPRPRS